MKFYVENDKSSAYTYPCIILKPDNWDDYSLKTTFIVHYYESQFSHKLIGSTKILYKELEVKDGDRDAWTFDFLQRVLKSWMKILFHWGKMRLIIIT